MRGRRTVDFYRRMEQKYSFANGQYRRIMTIAEALVELEYYVDASDPDLDLPNKVHLLQTAEGIRRAGQPDWLQLTGLLHDLGKIMFLWGNAEDGQDGTTANGPQWSLGGGGGDTWVVGCQIPNHPAVIYPHLNHLNPDQYDDRYNTKYGMYIPHCGLNALCFTWGHDEYLYRMLVANQNTCSTLPPEALDMIRYHSAYPLHSGSAGSAGSAYAHLLQLPADEERLEWVRLFNQFDLYSKDNAVTFTAQEMDEVIWPYYHGLLEKYGLAGPLKW